MNPNDMTKLVRDNIARHIGMLTLQAAEKEGDLMLARAYSDDLEKQLAELQDQLAKATQPTEPDPEVQP